MTELDIIIPVYNKGKHIGELLSTLLRDKELYDKIILVDDCSTDNSVAIIMEYQRLNPETIVLQIQERNQGPHNARLKGAEISDKTHVLYVDADDLLNLDGLRKVRNKNIDWAKHGIYFGHTIRQFEEKDSEKNNFVSNEKMTEITKPIDLLHGTCPTMSGIIIRNDVVSYMSVGKCEWGEDVLFYVNALNEGISFLFVEETLGIYRIMAASRGASGGTLKKRLRFISSLFRYSLKKISFSNIVYFLVLSSRTLIAWFVKLFR